MDPFVSIITVSLNSAATVRDTLDSVAKQVAPFDIEHICVDGGSGDGTREIIVLAALRNKRIVRLFEPDSGLFEAMNKGLRLARGRYILFLNSDDFLMNPTSIADAFRGIDPVTAAPDMIMGDVVMGLPNSVGLWRMRRVPRWLPYLPKLGAHPPHQGSFISRELLLRANGFDSEQRLAADTMQFYRLVHEFNPQMRISNSVVSFMRTGGASNRSLPSFSQGNRETYRFLRRYRSPSGAAFMIAVKVTQKLLEYRFGRLRKSEFLATPYTQTTYSPESQSN